MGHGAGAKHEVGEGDHDVGIAQGGAGLGHGVGASHSLGVGHDVGAGNSVRAGHEVGGSHRAGTIHEFGAGHNICARQEGNKLGRNAAEVAKQTPQCKRGPKSRELC